MPIFFLIYISGVFDSVSESYLPVISLSFVDDIRFIASGSSVKDIVLAFEKVAKTVLEWGSANAVTYDKTKTKAILFSKSHRQRLNRQIRENTISIGDKRIIFNKEAI